MKKYRLNVALGVVIGLTGLVSACSPSAQIDVAVKDQPVKVVAVESTLGEPVRSFPGHISAAEVSNTASKVAGQIIKIRVQPGDVVKTGQLMVELDPIDYQLSFDQAQANFDLASVSFTRIESSYKKGIATEATFDEAKSNLALARASLSMAQNQLANTKIYAPFSGIVVRVNPVEYDYISAGQSLIYLQSNQNTIDVDFQVPSDIVARANGNVTDDLISVVFDTLPDQKFKASVKEFSSDSDRSTRSFDVTLSVVKPPIEVANILPGMDATVLLDLSAFYPTASLLVPSNAVFKDVDKSYVWKVIDNVVHKTEVTLGQFRGDKLVVTQGLSAGDLIVAAGVHQLADERTVAIWDGE